MMHMTSARATAGLGAGIFGESSLGQDGGDYLYRWGEYSDGTLSQQIAANFELEQAGMPPVEEDGVLGAETCGAEAWIVGNLPNSATPHQAFLLVADCRSFDYPRSTGGGGGPSAPPPVVSPPAPTPAPSFGAGRTTLGWLLIAGGVAVGGIYFMKKKRRS